jgi:hypothetical protein
MAMVTTSEADIMSAYRVLGEIVGSIFCYDREYPRHIALPRIS